MAVLGSLVVLAVQYRSTKTRVLLACVAAVVLVAFVAFGWTSDDDPSGPEATTTTSPPATTTTTTVPPTTTTTTTTVPPTTTTTTTTVPPTTTTTTTTVPPTTTTEPFSGGCDPFAVYSQGRWGPSGATVRDEPYPAAPEVRTVQANAVISVDGWAETEAPYPTTNEPPWNSAVWFRLTSRAGYVSFAGVRAEPTTPAGTDGPHQGGQPVELRDECQLHAAQ